MTIPKIMLLLLVAAGVSICGVIKGAEIEVTVVDRNGNLKKNIYVVVVAQVREYGKKYKRKMKRRGNTAGGGIVSLNFGSNKFYFDGDIKITTGFVFRQSHYISSGSTHESYYFNRR